MGRYDVNHRESFAEQATRAAMRLVEFPVDLTGVWGRHQRPKTTYGSKEYSRVIIGEIRLWNKKDRVGSTCDVFERDGHMTAEVVLSVPGGHYSLRFHAWIEGNEIKAAEDKRYRNNELALLELRAVGITRHPQFQYYASCHPHEATALHQGLSNGSAILETAIQDFETFQQEHLKPHPTPA